MREDQANIVKAESQASSGQESSEREMAMLELHNNQEYLPPAITLDQLEARMLKMDQVSAPVIHRFGVGVYIREINLKAGSIAVGHIQKFNHNNVFLSGRVLMLTEDGIKDMQAPMVYVGTPGRKVGYIVEDVVWQNIYATDETDIEKLESAFIDKSECFQQYEQNVFEKAFDAHESDRIDFRSLVSEYGYTLEQVRAQSENELDQVPMPEGSWGFKVGKSPIQGKGIIASNDFHDGDLIAPALINGLRTPVGRYCNHSKEPNARFIMSSVNNFDLIAVRDIQGNLAGCDGEEITVNYRDVLELRKGMLQ
jgi:hypothetical protein